MNGVSIWWATALGGFGCYLSFNDHPAAMTVVLAAVALAVVICLRLKDSPFIALGFACLGWWAFNYWGSFEIPGGLL